MRFREAGGDGDIELEARLSTEQAPHHPMGASEVAVFWRYEDLLGPVRRLALEGKASGRALVKVGREGQVAHAWVEVYFPSGSPPELDEAYALAEDEARGLGAREGVTELWEDGASHLEAVTGRGWKRRRRIRFWRLELQPARRRLEGEAAAARRRVEAAGLRVLPASALGGEAVYPALHEIHNLSHVDIPRSVEFLPEPFEGWREWMGPPRTTPERVWVAVSAGRLVGYSYLSFLSSGHVETGYTGVLREHRGRGVARALKLETLVQAAELGVEWVETDNDSENAPIIHLNQELGYQETTGQIEFAKEL